jgi:hypothetical protein
VLVAAAKNIKNWFVKVRKIKVNHFQRRLRVRSSKYV